MKLVSQHFVYLVLVSALLLLATVIVSQAHAEDAPVASALEDYFEFTEDSSSLIWPEQIPAQAWKNIFVVDTRSEDQYAKAHIPGAINIEWRQVVKRRHQLPKDRMVVMYCNSGSLSAQAVLALRALGMDNVKVLQDGYEGWKAKGGFDAYQRATKPAGH